MPEFSCSVTQSPARWSAADVLVWQVVPESWGGGRTSFGAVSMPLRAAAHRLGLNPAQLTMAPLRGLAGCPENGASNIDIVARHLRQIIGRDGVQTQPPALSEDAVRVAGARYHLGLGLSLERRGANTRDGDFTLRFRPRLAGLLGT